MTPQKHFNIADLLEMVADAVPDRTALVCAEQRATYRELDTRANQLAHFLGSRGIRPGQHVGLYLYNCNEYLESVLACFKLRAVPVNVNYRYVREELEYMFDNADMVACIHHREFVPHIAEVHARVAGRLRTFLAVNDGSATDLHGIGAIEYEQALAHQSGARDFGERAADDLFILYTGGTTGMPKGVLWPHKAIFFAALGGGGMMSPDGPCQKPEDIVSRISPQPIAGMPLAPLMHGACWWYAMIQLLGGNKVVLNPQRHLKGEQVWDLVEKEQVNAVSIVGDAMAVPLLEALEAHPGRWNLSALFNVGSGGAVFSEAKQERFRALLPHIYVYNSFGSSESGATGPVAPRDRSTSGLGRMTRSEFLDVLVEDNGGRRRARPGETGILARSGHIPIGYYKDPEKTAKTFVEADGKQWILTGDAATLEGDGSTMTVFGRGSNCIESGGEKVFPEEVEQAIKAHPDVLDALVVGTPDERWGNKVTAVIATRGNRPLALAALQREARKHIAGYKVPREVHIVDEVPRTPSGKPNYIKAKELALSGRHRVA